MIGDEDLELAWGTDVVVPKYIHDPLARDASSVGEQELAIGRAKLSDIELLDDVKPANMFIAKPPGNCDRIFDVSTAVTGNLFFVPMVDFLDDPPDFLDDAPGETRAGAATVPGVRGDGSLGLGGLRGGHG